MWAATLSYTYTLYNGEFSVHEEEAPTYNQLPPPPQKKSLYPAQYMHIMLMHVSTLP